MRARHGHVNELGFAMGLGMTMTMTMRLELELELELELGLGLGFGTELLIFDQNFSSSSSVYPYTHRAYRRDERESSSDRLDE